MHNKIVTIKKIVNGGFGLGHLPAGQVVLVQFALPEEVITVSTEESKKKYLLAKVHQIENHHPARITAPCQYYGICGGCNLQHCDYDSQIIFKRDILIDLLLHQNVVTPKDAEEKIHSIIGAAAPFHYRQRIRLQVRDDYKLGFNRFRSHDIVEIDMCLLAKPSINMALTALKQHDDIHALLELSSELELQQNPLTDKISCIFIFSRKPRPADFKAAARLCSEINCIDRVFFTGEDFPIVGPIVATNTKQDNLLTVRYPEINHQPTALELSWEVGGFCQVNLEQNKQMIETVLDFCSISPGDTVLDLYCGMGNFAIPISHLAASVYGIEGQGSSIRCAKNNASLAQVDNTTFNKQPVHNGCKELIEKGSKFDCIIIDPPRLGAPELAAQLSQLCNKRLVYISCDPATLSRDLKALTREGFTIKAIKPVDMFPQTHHIETVVLLER
ncbi:MAG: 23S rRNA (uracil(1939)-C(5))-methyltransferase RlmD [Desulfotalea sp.]|nr:MAG: 23S rRNA (uracil(1939)-C(5))-methyltransferase RlmD [Desulfotalea sp.]